MTARLWAGCQSLGGGQERSTAEDEEGARSNGMRPGLLKGFFPGQLTSRANLTGLREAPEVGEVWLLSESLRMLWERLIRVSGLSQKAGGSCSVFTGARQAQKRPTKQGEHVPILRGYRGNPGLVLGQQISGRPGTCNHETHTSPSQS